MFSALLLRSNLDNTSAHAMRMGNDKKSQQTAAAGHNDEHQKKIIMFGKKWFIYKIEIIIVSWQIYDPSSLSCSHIWHTYTHLVQLPAKALKNVMLVDLENRLALIEDGMHDHAQWVHVRGRVTADGQDVFRGQVLGVGEAERREVGLPLFTRVLRLKRTSEHENTKDVTILLDIEHLEGSTPCLTRLYCPTEQKSFQHTSASEGLVEEMLKSKPMIFQDPLLLRMMFSGHKLPWTIFTPLWRKDKPSEIWRERKEKRKCQGNVAFTVTDSQIAWMRQQTIF